MFGFEIPQKLKKLFGAPSDGTDTSGDSVIFSDSDDAVSGGGSCDSGWCDGGGD